MKTFIRSLRSLVFLFSAAALISAIGCGSNPSAPNNPSGGGAAQNTGWNSTNGGGSGTNTQTLQALSGTYTGTIQKRILDANYNYQNLSQTFSITIDANGTLTFNSSGSVANLNFQSPLTTILDGYAAGSTRIYQFQTNILRLATSSANPDYVTLAVDFRVIRNYQGQSYLDAASSSAAMLVCGTYSGSCTTQQYTGLTFTPGLSKIR